MLIVLLLLQGSAAIDDAARSVPGMDAGKWSRVDDAAFLERVTRDLWGEAAADAPAFVADQTPDKRARAIDALLASPKFAAHWGRRLSAWLIGEPADYRIDLAGLDPKVAEAAAAGFARWMTEGAGADRPWTETVRAMIEARGDPTAAPELAWKLRFSESRTGAREKAVDLAARLFGFRLGCAVCHDQPYDRWRVEDVYGLAAFFVRDRARSGDGLRIELKVSEEGEMEIPRAPEGDDKDAKVKMALGGTAAPVFLFGGMAGKNDDRPKALAALATAKGNTQLPRAFVNRVWASLFGKGIVDPPDDFNLRNKPSSPALLDVLSRGFADGGHRLKPLLRAICASEIYQGVDLTDPEKAEWSSYRGLIVRPPTPRARPFTPFVLELPPEWVLLPPRSGLPYGFRVPGKDGKAPGLFGVVSGGSDWTNQVRGGKTKSETFEGPVTIKLTDLAGTYTCDPTSSGPRENWRILRAELRAETSLKHVRLEGPADTVEEWKARFIDMLRKARKAP